MIKATLNWLRGTDPLEEETWRLIDLRQTMTASEWLDLAEPHYERLLREHNCGLEPND